MEIEYTKPDQRTSPLSKTLSVITVIAGGILLFLLLVMLLVVGFEYQYSGRVYPGITVAGVNLDGMTKSEAAIRIAQNVTYPQTGRVVFEYGEQVWTANPAGLGMSLDPVASAETAFNYGRHGNPITRFYRLLSARRNGQNLPPIFNYDERASYDYMTVISDQVNLPTLEARIDVDGTQITAVSGQIGRSVDIESTIAPLEEQLSSMSDGIMPLVVTEQPPEIMDASEGAETARKLIEGPLRLYIPEATEADSGPWLIDPEGLARMLNIQIVRDESGAEFDVSLDETALNTYISALSPDVARLPGNARFIFNDDTRLLEVIEPAVTGRALDIYSTIQQINEGLLNNVRDFPLAVSEIKPEITDQTTGAELGISELVSWHTSYFRGSSQERMNNIEVAASNFHGLLIPPGATFSMGDTMGSVSLDTGYSEAWIIFGGRTIKGVGGGVCQVSTTLFRTAFLAGFPVVERYPHAYRVGYYEQTVNGLDDDLAGLDATVFVPLVDFKFVNDSPNWLLMETYINSTARSLTWKFYSTSDGRDVAWETTGPQNRVDPPEPKYEENPDLAKGEIKQVDWAAEGADVTVTRTVMKNGTLLFEDVFTTYYQPWQDVFQYGPGTELPDSKKKFEMKKRGPRG